MLVISGPDMNGLISEIAQRVRSVSDHNGDPVVLPTIPPGQLRAAAIAALMIATGEVIWPGDKPLDLKSKQQDSFLEVRR